MSTSSTTAAKTFKEELLERIKSNEDYADKEEALARQDWESHMRRVNRYRERAQEFRALIKCLDGKLTPESEKAVMSLLGGSSW